MRIAKNLVVVIILILGFQKSFSQDVRSRNNIDFNWFFQLGDIKDAELVEFKHSSWRKLDLPHDWSIEGEYSKDGSKSNGFLPGGIGWYRKVLTWDKNWKNSKVTIEFDGVFMNSKVWINGHFLGQRPYGYIPFSYDLTPYLNTKDNVIAVRVDNSKLPSARWYTGSGIYRHVYIEVTGKIHVAHNGTLIRTPQVSASKASVSAETSIENETGENVKATIVSIILDDKGKEVAKNSKDVVLGDSTIVTQTIDVKHPSLWSPETPAVYYLKTIIRDGRNILDTYSSRFGFRAIEFSASGFKLNGHNVKFKGVCEHQDMGPLGTAVPEDALHKKLVMLKAMGCNAIRTTHHPFAPEFYAMCDTMGFMVMDEAFDGWDHWENTNKAAFDYGIYFNNWWQRDVKEFVTRDRNFPCVMIWSMGNEVSGYEKHLDLQKQINDLFHSLDPTRPTTQAWAPSKYLDIAGFNANGEGKGALENFHKKNPDMPAIGTEMPHTRSTRGIYRTHGSLAAWDEVKSYNKGMKNLFPIDNLTDQEIFNNYDHKYASGYDNQTRKITIREEFKQVRDHDYFLGDFRWTGFDYLGEAWSWPSRTNNYGIIDLACAPKDPYYLYQSLWTEKPMIHILPHWTLLGMENVIIPVVAYTNADSAELFLNGKSFGKKQMNKDTLQIVWNVPYQPGKISAVAYKNGKVVASDEYVTAGNPASIELVPDKKEIHANKRDLVYVEVNIRDAQGNFVPTACKDTVRFEVSGPYKLIGVENGDILDMSPQKVLWRKSFMGKALLVLQATDKPGKIEIDAKADQLKSAHTAIEVK